MIFNFEGGFRLGLTIFSRKRHLLCRSRRTATFTRRSKGRKALLIIGEKTGAMRKLNVLLNSKHKKGQEPGITTTPCVLAPLRLGVKPSS